jgi:hypothetical protein
MYGVQFRTGIVESLGKQRFVVFDAEVGNQEIARQHEKSTQDQGEADGPDGWSKRVHGSGAETEMVAKAPGRGEFGLASKLLSLGLVQTSMGQRTKDSPNEGFGALKPLAQNSVYTDADYKTR